MLDHSTILFGSNMSNSDRHNNDPLPSAILGHAQRKHQGRPAPEVSAGFAPRRSAADAARAQRDPGEIDRRQRRRSLGGLEHAQVAQWHHGCDCGVLLARRARCMASASPRYATTLLRRARKRGDHAAAMRLLRAKGANVNATGADGTTAIMYAAANDDRRTGARADQGRRERQAEEPVRHVGASPKPRSSAPRRSSTRCSRPAPIPTSRTPEGETPLMAAARSGKVDAAKAAARRGRRHQRQGKLGRANARSCGPPRRARPRW